MTPLLPDVCRCEPEFPDNYCKNCRRWLSHPEQVISPRTLVVNVETSASEACAYIPVSFQERLKRV
jgi:hypothetical protein